MINKTCNPIASISEFNCVNDCKKINCYWYMTRKLEINPFININKELNNQDTRLKEAFFPELDCIMITNSIGIYCPEYTENNK